METRGRLGLVCHHDLGFTALIAFLALAKQPCKWCPSALGRLSRNIEHDSSGHGEAFAYGGRGARMVDSAGRADLYRPEGRQWLVLRQLAGILMAGTLVWLAQRPGAQAGVMTNAQSILLFTLLLSRPWSSAGSWFVDVFVYAMRSAVLLLALEFVPPFGEAGTAGGEPVGSALVAVQAAVAMVLTGLVIVRFPCVARGVANWATPRDVGSLLSEQSTMGAASPGLPEMATAGPGSLQFQNNPMMAAGKRVTMDSASSTPTRPHASSSSGGRAERKGFPPSEAGREGTARPGNDGTAAVAAAPAPGAVGQSKTGLDDMQGGARPEEILTAKSTDASARASRRSQRIPKENPLLAPKRKSVSKLC